VIQTATLLQDASASLERLAAELEAVPGIRLCRLSSRDTVLRQPPDVLLLSDDGSGSALRQTRASMPDVGLIALLEGSAETGQRIACIENGADMVLAGDVGIAELLACVRALYRRTCSAKTSYWTLCLKSRRLLAPDGGEVHLSTLEYLFLRQLAQASPQPVRREQLSTALGFDYAAFDERRLEAMVSRLRRKLPQQQKANASVVRSARLHGYVFAEPIGIDTRH